MMLAGAHEHSMASAVERDEAATAAVAQDPRPHMQDEVPRPKVGWAGPPLAGAGGAAERNAVRHGGAPRSAGARDDKSDEGRREGSADGRPSAAASTGPHTAAHALVTGQLLACALSQVNSDVRGLSGEWRRSFMRAACDGLRLKSATARAALLVSASDPSRTLAHNNVCAAAEATLGLGPKGAGARALRMVAVELLRTCALDAHAVCVLRHAGQSLRVPWPAVVSEVDEALRAWSEGGGDGGAEGVPVPGACAGVTSVSAPVGTDAGLAAGGAGAEGDMEESAHMHLLAARTHMGAAWRRSSLEFRPEGVPRLLLRRASARPACELVLCVTGFATLAQRHGPSVPAGAPEEAADAQADAARVESGADTDLAQGGEERLAPNPLVPAATVWDDLARATPVHEVWQADLDLDQDAKIARALLGSAPALPSGTSAFAPSRSVAVVPAAWTAAGGRARVAGQALGAILERRVLGRRPVTLIGVSLGARAIFHCLEYLATRGLRNLVLDVLLLGGAVTSKGRRWEGVRSVVAGRVLNAYSGADAFLRAHHMVAHLASPPPAGVVPVHVARVEDCDVSTYVQEHKAYGDQAVIMGLTATLLWAWPT